MTFPRLRLLLILAPVSVLVLSCTSPVCGCPPSRSHAVAYGTVRTAEGIPVPGATMGITIYRQECGVGFAEPGDNWPTRHASALGSYETHFFSISSPSTACIRVTATRGQGDGADSVSVDHAPVTLRHERNAPERVRVDLVFP